MQGFREEQEDAHVCIEKLEEEGFFSKWSFFMVLDGHGGKVPAQYISKNILPTILKQTYFNQLKEQNSNSETQPNLDTDRIKIAIKNAFKDLDAELYELFKSKGNQYKLMKNSSETQEDK